jgi:hypothetical protein
MGSAKLLAELSDADLLARLDKFEDSFVERKTSGDHHDWVKTVVAFANTAPTGFPAVLFVGVRDDGTAEGGLDLDKLQKTFGEKMLVVYPPIYYLMKILEFGGKQFLAVIVPGSTDRPHFSGPSYVRRGSHTHVASEADYDNFIAVRQHKARELLQWKGKDISVDYMRTEHVHTLGPTAGSAVWRVIDCNPFFATFATASITQSVPLRRIEISFDNVYSRLKIELYPV